MTDLINSGPLNILALEPYYGGSHRAMLDAWSSGSRHTFTLLTFPPYHWKWRMRHAAVTFAEQVNRLLQEDESTNAARQQTLDWDMTFTCSMLDLATFRGLVDRRIAALPTVVYFHENQLTYPVRNDEPRDLHFGLTNMTSAMAADSVWFNSAFHRDDFLAALDRQLRKLPPVDMGDPIRRIREKSVVEPPLVKLIDPDVKPPSGRTDHEPIKILWAARWEHDKNPGDFFAALRLLDQRGVDFRVSVVGEQFSDVPGVFEESRPWLGRRVMRWGYQSSRVDYEQAVRQCDVVVSTAKHEFFGIAIVEAVSAGLFPLLPERLAYPELLSRLQIDPSERPAMLYHGTPEQLADRLAALAQQPELYRNSNNRAERIAASCRVFDMPDRIEAMDRRIATVFSPQ